jgi:predicted nucleic acid-binding protein
VPPFLLDTDIFSLWAINHAVVRARVAAHPPADVGITVSRAALDRYDALRALKLNVGNYDLRIAAVALEADATIITCNLPDFRRVPGLNCEDWSV